MLRLARRGLAAGTDAASMITPPPCRDVAADEADVQERDRHHDDEREDRPAPSPGRMSRFWLNFS